jgi:hypothetical protein
MSHIDYATFFRLLIRCEEIATAEGARPGVVLVHDRCLAPVAKSFRDAHTNMPAAQSAARKARATAAVTFASFDVLYREARAVVLAFVPTLVLPETLKSQPTDTDRVNAIRELCRILESNAGAIWADELRQGAFGAAAATAVLDLKAIAMADERFATARQARATLYKEARVQFFAFKRVVREAYGSKSHEYRRIHLRGKAGGEAEKEEAVVQGDVRESPPRPSLTPGGTQGGAGSRRGLLPGGRISGGGGGESFPALPHFASLGAAQESVEK